MASYGGGERERESGGGGKLRKSSNRKPPTTPYDRPQSRHVSWISKLVGGATRILPSLFSKSPPLSSEEYNDPEEEENADVENKTCSSNPGESEAAEGTNLREGVQTLNYSSDADQLGQDKRNNLPGGNEFSKIEQLVKERQFSRDDVNRLLELLHSNKAEASNVEQVGKNVNNSARREGEGSMFASETPRWLFKEKQESLNVAGLATPRPLFQSNVEEVGASPIDIARAYMGNRVPEVSNDYKGTMTKHVGDSVRSDKYSSQALVPSSSPKTSVCWPGAMAEDRFGQSTPQSVSSRYGLHQFQRSPYSRSIYSKSKSKLARPEADSNRFQNFPSSTKLQSQTPIFGQSDRIHNEISGSAGPIRRVRRKFLSEASPRGSASYHSSQNGQSPTTFTNSFLPSMKNLDSAASKATTEFRSVGPTTNGSEAGFPAFQNSNSAIRAILEHLDRKPTPKERSAELLLASSANKSSFSKSTDTGLEEENDRAKSCFEERPQQRSEATDVDKDPNTSTFVNGKYDYQHKSSKETFSFGLSNIRVKNIDTKSTSRYGNEGLGVTNTPLNSTIPESLKRPPHHPSGPKPNLTSISVDKPNLRHTFSSDSNNSGFTFPVSSRSGALPEPPTPSVMPSSTAGCPPQQNNNDQEIPKFSFGEKRSTPGLNFSFPSTSNASSEDEVSDLKFSFGAGQKSRLSFKSVGKVASF